MKVTKDVIGDLFPLYLSQECSEDTRQLIEQYLRENPREAEALGRVLAASVPPPAPAGQLDELASFNEARRRLRWRTWLMAFAIFFTFAPLSFYVDGQKTWWFLTAAPKSAAIYAAIGVACWIGYFLQRKASRGL